jgi:hypothetical protein
MFESRLPQSLDIGRAIGGGGGGFRRRRTVILGQPLVRFGSTGVTMSAMMTPLLLDLAPGRHRQSLLACVSKHNLRDQHENVWALWAAMQPPWPITGWRKAHLAY